MPSSDLAKVFLSTSGGTNTEVWASLLSSVVRRWQLTSSTSSTDADTLTAGHADELRLVVAQRIAATISQGTASALLVPTKTQSETTIEALIATDEARVLREQAHGEHDASVDNHQSKYLDEWQQRVKEYSERSHQDILHSLWRSGLSWREIARLMKVSIAAIQKWRTGESPSSANFARLRDFAAVYDMVAAHKPNADIANWLDVPILTDVPIRPIDLWTDHADHEVFFEYALGSLKSEEALDAFDPDWRRRYREDGFATVVGEDGRLMITTKSR